VKQAFRSVAYLIRGRAAGRLESFREVPDGFAIKSPGLFELTSALVCLGIKQLRAMDVDIVQMPVVLERSGK
jgi:signal recognition particle subunit SEC65